MLAPGVVYPDGSVATAEDLMFIRSLIENLVVYGYTNYRLLLIREDGQAVFQVRSPFRAGRLFLGGR